MKKYFIFAFCFLSRRSYILLVFLCVGVLLSVTLSALGTLRVESIKELPPTHTSLEVRDADGKWAPVLIVKTELKGLGFKNIGRPTKHAPIYNEKKNEYKFYMNDKQRVVEITHSEYEPLEVRLLADYNIEVHAQSVYEMVLSNEPEKIYIPINIVTDPTGARIYIDGKDKGINETQKVYIGKHKIRIHKKGYKTITDEIEVTENKTLFKYSLTEIEDVPIMIYSEPEGATVYIDNIKIGETPLASFYPDGNYKINIEKRLYETIDEQIIIKLPKIEKRYILEPMYATLNIKTYPNATVYLNETKLDSLHNLHLEPMLINLRVTMPKAEQLEKRIILKKNEIRTLDLFPNVKTGTIQVGIIPEDAKIELLGDGGEYYTANEISNFKDIPVGKYELKVSKEGYGIYKEIIILKEGKKIKKQIKLIIRKDDVNMIFVQGGSFQMGSINGDKDEKPVHTVTVNDFYIGKTEVTQKEWNLVMNNIFEGIDFDDLISGKVNPFNVINRGDSILIQRKDMIVNDPSKWKGNNLPVESLSWYDAIEFCNKKSEAEGLESCYSIIKEKPKYDFSAFESYEGEFENEVMHVNCNFSANGYRLPTEAEWEYASRGGSRTAQYKYSGSNNIDDVAWYVGNSESKTHPVGQKKANELGIYDMSGNVWEWCWDWYDSNYYKNSPVNNPSGPLSGTYRIIRGGGWENGIYWDLFSEEGPIISLVRASDADADKYMDYCAKLCMVSNRSYGDHGHGYSGIGFRLCRNAEIKNNGFLNLLNEYLIYIILLMFIIISLSVVLLILRKRRKSKK